jgi:hypothetical protein
MAKEENMAAKKNRPAGGKKLKKVALKSVKPLKSGARGWIEINS